MANAKIKWTQKVAGRDEGAVETVEIDTVFMRGCLANRRYEILEIINPVVVEKKLKLDPTPNEKPKPAPRPNRSETRKDEGDGAVEAQGRTWV